MEDSKLPWGACALMLVSIAKAAAEAAARAVAAAIPGIAVAGFRFDTAVVVVVATAVVGAGERSVREAIVLEVAMNVDRGCW